MLDKTLFTRVSAVLLLVCITGACSSVNRAGDTVRVQHSPIVATNTQPVTYTATANTESTDYRIRLFANGSLIKTCYNTSPCVHTDAAYGSLVSGDTVDFIARLDTFDCDLACDKVDGYYHFGIIGVDTLWGTTTYAPARVSVGTWSNNSGTDSELLFHMADDYAINGKDYDDFLSDVHSKIYDVLGAQSITENNLDNFDFYVYTREATTGSCGTVAWQTNTEVPFRDDDAILHDDILADCTDGGLSHFTAEGSNTESFLHEAGHGIFGLASENAGASGYFQPVDEPNIWSSEAGCLAEQALKNRGPYCYEFTTGWWGIHTGTTVMSSGNVGDAWGTEASEHVHYYFDHL